jgi:type II secretory pathway component PulF
MMAKLEIFQNGTSLHPDTMGDPVYQIGTKNADGEYDVVVFEAMTEKQAKEKLKELKGSKPASKKSSSKKKASSEKKVSKKKKKG